MFPIGINELATRKNVPRSEVVQVLPYSTTSRCVAVAAPAVTRTA